MSKTFSTADVATHNKGTDMYIIVDEDVYDLTTFQDEHPGGKKSESCPRYSLFTRSITASTILQRAFLQERFILTYDRSPSTSSR